MFEKTLITIKIIGVINTTINLLLLLLLLYISFSFVPSGYMQFVILGFFIILINIILGGGVLLLNNLFRRIFVIVQIVSLFLTIWPFLCMLTLGLGSAGRFGDDFVSWSSFNTPLFWQQFFSFISGMSILGVPMLFSIFCIIYLMRPKISEQFK